MACEKTLTSVTGELSGEGTESLALQFQRIRPREEVLPLLPRGILVPENVLCVTPTITSAAYFRMLGNFFALQEALGDFCKVGQTI